MLKYFGELFVPAADSYVTFRTPHVLRFDAATRIPALRTAVCTAVCPAAPVNTNDAFVGFDSETLKTGGSSKIYPPAWDAGERVLFIVVLLLQDLLLNELQ